MTIQIKYLMEYPTVVSIIAKWIYQEWGYIEEYNSIEKLVTRYRKTLNKNQIPITWIALGSDKPIGCVSIFDYDVAGGNKLSPWLVALYVDKNHRRKGIGSLLVNHAIEGAKKMGYQKLYLFTGKDHRQTYYENLGWCVIDTLTYHEQPKVVMEYKIATIKN